MQSQDSFIFCFSRVIKKCSEVPTLLIFSAQYSRDTPKNIHKKKQGLLCQKQIIFKIQK